MHPKNNPHLPSGSSGHSPKKFVAPRRYLHKSPSPEKQSSPHSHKEFKLVFETATPQQEQEQSTTMMSTSMTSSTAAATSRPKRLIPVDEYRTIQQNSSTKGTSSLSSSSKDSSNSKSFCCCSRQRSLIGCNLVLFVLWFGHTVHVFYHQSTLHHHLSPTTTTTEKSKLRTFQKPGDIDAMILADRSHKKHEQPASGGFHNILNDSKQRGVAPIKIPSYTNFPYETKAELMHAMQTILHQAGHRVLSSSSSSSHQRQEPYQFKNVNAQRFVENHADDCQNKEPLVDIIFASNTVLNSNGQTQLVPPADTVCQQLPTMDTIQSIHGLPDGGPVVHGLETCWDYQQTLKQNKDSLIDPTLSQQKNHPWPGPRVGGLYHSGTNALVRTLENNLVQLPKLSEWDSPFELPWGKHVHPKHRMTNTFPDSNPDLKEYVLPVILIRNPYQWLMNMCLNGYDAKFYKTRTLGCPRMFLNDATQKTNIVRVKAHQTAFKLTDEYPTTAEMWSQWYRGYLDADFPRLMIRYEDTLLYAEEIFQVIRLCSGAQPASSSSSSSDGGDSPFVYHAKEARLWGGKGSLQSALIKLGESIPYYEKVGGAEQTYLMEKGLDPDLLQTFRYKSLPEELRPDFVFLPKTPGYLSSKRLIRRKPPPPKENQPDNKEEGEKEDQLSSEGGTIKIMETKQLSSEKGGQEVLRHRVEQVRERRKGFLSGGGGGLDIDGKLEQMRRQREEMLDRRKDILDQLNAAKEGRSKKRSIKMKS